MTDNTFTRMGPSWFDEAKEWMTPRELSLVDHIRAAYDEMDRLRANALKWVTVTEDPKTLPDQDSDLDVLVDTVRWDSGEPTEMRTYYVLHLESDSIENLSPGDRWAYIPQLKECEHE